MRATTFTLATLGTAIVLATGTPPMAGGHLPSEKREAAMGTIGESTKTIGGMLKGEIAFESMTAGLALEEMQAAIAGFADLYPDGSQGETSNKYLASDAVWTDRAGFEAEIAKFEAAVAAAIAADPQDVAALGAAFGPIGGTCKSCHEGYRTQQ